MTKSATRLDSYDLRILAALQQDGRMTKVRLANEIGLSPSPCFERVRRLEDAGYISRYSASVDINKIVRISTIFTEVELKSHQSSDCSLFERIVSNIPIVVEAYATSGSIDYILKCTAISIEHYQRSVADKLENCLAVSRFYTYFSTRPIKPFRGFPIDELISENDHDVDEMRRSQS